MSLVLSEMGIYYNRTVIVVLVWVLPSILSAQIRSITFDNLTTDQGLSNSSVTAILQDHEGFMWIGTSNGLNRYDGHQFKTFEHSPEDSTTINNNSIHSLLEDSQGNLWVGTDASGILKYIREKERFRLIQAKDSTGEVIGPRYTICFLEKGKDVWIGSKTGLFYFDTQTEEFINFRHQKGDPFSLPHNTVISIAYDKDSTLWVGTKEGLCRMNPDGKSFTSYLAQDGKEGALQNNLIEAMLLDSKGRLWIGTHHGLYQLVKKDQKYSFKRFGHGSLGLNDQIISAITEDEDGLWIGTYNGGLNFWNAHDSSFSSYEHINQDPKSLLAITVWAIFKDRGGTIWVGTDDGGLSKIDRNNLSFYSIKINNLGSDKIQSTSIRAILEDQWGEVWIGLQNSGIIHLDPLNKTIKHYTHNPDDPKSLPNNHIRGLAEDRFGNIWIGTSENLIRFNRSDNSFKAYFPFPETGESRVQYVRYISEGKDGKIYITNRHHCTIVYDPETNSFDSTFCNNFKMIWK